VIGQNFVGTLVVDGIGVGLAAFGLLDPLSAAFVHVASELAFILNSARLLPALSRKESSRRPSTWPNALPSASGAARASTAART